VRQLLGDLNNSIVFQYLVTVAIGLKLVHNLDLSWFYIFPFRNKSRNVEC